MSDFLALHVKGQPLLQPNAWDAGSARILAAIGFSAIATTSSGFAATLGRRDGHITRDEALAHCRALSAAVDIPVAADLENCFADDPAGVAETVRLAAETGLAGLLGRGLVGQRDLRPHAGFRAGRRRRRGRAPARLVITARAEDLLHGGNLDEAIARVQAYSAVGADVLFVPGLRKADDIRAVVSAVDRPVNVLVAPRLPADRRARRDGRGPHLRRWLRSRGRRTPL